MTLRLASPEDGPALLAIYARYIHSAVTFEYELPSRAEFARRIRETLEVYPYLVLEKGGTPLGYAYAHRLGERAAYQWNAELSVYLDRACTGRGLGSSLYRALMDLLRLQGVKTAYAVVTHPNPASEGLHRSLGFRLLGFHQNTGYKNGIWHDVAWFEKALAPYGPRPRPVTPITQIPAEDISRVLSSHSPHLE